MLRPAGPRQPATPQPADDPRAACEAIAGRPEGSDADIDFDDIDAARATPVCEAAVTASPNDGRLMLLLGKSLDKGRDYVAAAEWYQRAVNAGETAAINNLGTLYEVGQGVPQDYAKAFELYQEGAKVEDPQAINNLGWFYETGSAVKRDYAKARELYEKAADLGNAMAINNLGALYDNGYGVPRDSAKAKQFYEQAEELGNSLAIKNLGGLYENGRGVPKDLATAREYYVKASDLGNADAAHQLGYFADDGIAGEQDREAAAGYIELALRRGSEASLSQMKTNSSAWSSGFRKARQARLKAACVYDGAVDGRFGPATYTAMDEIFGTE